MIVPVVAFVAALVASASAYPPNCTYVYAGCRIDLSPLRSPERDYEAIGAPDGSVIYLNACQPIANRQCGNLSSACYVWDPEECLETEVFGCASLGSADMQRAELVPGGMRVTFDGGWFGRTMAIDFSCAEATDPRPTWIPNPGSRDYFFRWGTELACCPATPAPPMVSGATSPSPHPILRAVLSFFSPRE